MRLNTQPLTTPRARDRSFQTAFDRAAVGLALVSPEGRWLRYNQHLCDLLGYSREELAARTWQDLTSPDDRDASDAFFWRLLTGERDAYDLDQRYVRKDGALVWVHLTASLVRTPEGEPDYVLATLEDITERKRLERDRAQLQALTDTALSHLALDDLLRELLGRVLAVMDVDHVGILLLDEDGRTLTVRAARGVLEDGVGRVRIPVGQGLGGRIAASRESLIVDDLSTCDPNGVDARLRQHLRSLVGVPLLVEDQAEDHLVSRLVGVVSVGSATPRRFTAADVQLLQRAADRIALAIDRARLYAAEQDARRQAEVALGRAQASEAQATERAERLRAILETMADGVAVYDAEGRPIQLVNRAYRELYAVERAPAGYETLPTFDRARLLHLRDAATGAPLPFADRAERGHPRAGVRRPRAGGELERGAAARAGRAYRRRGLGAARCDLAQAAGARTRGGTRAGRAPG